MYLLKRPIANIAHLISMIVLAGFPGAASAMYKCVDANGTTGFQDSPCLNVHDKSYDPVIGTKGPMPIEAPKRNVPQPVESPTQEVQPNMPLPQSNQIWLDAPKPNVNATQSGTGGSAAVGKQKVDLWGFLVGLAVYLGFAALQGWWASARNRSFWGWFFLALLINPLLIMLIFLFRGKDPELPSWAR